MVDSGLMQGNLVCMLTAKYSVDPVLGEFAPWVIEYIRKPFEPKTLIAAVTHCLACLEH
jgi:DNA-binding response OmpR family regulator